jgi:hypothetical protein
MPLRPHPIETLLTALAGWLPLLGGLVLLAMTLITPEWMGWRDLVWQRDMLKLQAQSLETQRDSYSGFHDALSADDPVLLERLAFTHLRYKPAGKHLMDDLWLVSGPAPGSAPGVGAVAGTGSGPYGTAGSSEVIESWLAAPQPVVGRDIRPLIQMNTRLTRLTRGPSRYVLLAVAILCLIASLWPEKPVREDETQAVGPATAPPRPFQRFRAA